MQSELYSKRAFSRMLMLCLLSLIAKWKKQGYEKLCCVRCIQTKVRG